MPFVSLIAALSLLNMQAPPEPGAAAETPLRIENAWVREAPPGADVLAAYAMFCNDSDAAVTLVNAASKAFGSVQMHATVESDGAVTMQRLDSAVIAAHDCTAFEPGGRHFMLMKPKRAFRAGDRVEFTFFLANGKELEIAFPVRRGGGKPDQQEHHHEHH